MGVSSDRDAAAAASDYTASAPAGAEEPDVEAALTGPAAEAAAATPDYGAGDADGESPLVLVLLGRVGVGKSSTANMLVGPAGTGSEPFVSRRSAAAVTRVCRAEALALPERQVLVLDTPGLGDTAMPDAEVHTEIRRGFAEVVPRNSPVCLLFVLSMQGRVGEDDLAAVTGLKEKVFGEDMMANAIVVWTHADTLDAGSGLEGYLEGADERLRAFLGEASGGFVAVNNRLPPNGDSALSQQALDVVARAAAAAGQRSLARLREERIYGRRTARRKRQIEAGLIRRPEPRPEGSGGCAVA